VQRGEGGAKRWIRGGAGHVRLPELLRKLVVNNDAAEAQEIRRREIVHAP